MDYTAIGDATNLAARLQQLAPPDCIYASERTYRLVEAYIDCEPLEERTVKGRKESVSVYQLLGARPVSASRPLCTLLSISPKKKSRAALGGAQSSDHLVL
jgi:class 3 adenylate cyclase